MNASAAESKAQLKNRFAGLLAAPTSPAAPTEPEPAALETPGEPEPAAAPAPAKRARKATAKPRPATAKPRPAAAAPSSAQPPMPIAQAEIATGRPQRLMVPLSADEDRALKTFRLDDGVPAAARVRAMLQLYREDPRFRKKVDETVKRMR